MQLAKAIVLKIIPYSDNQKIIRAYTKEMGYLSLISPAYITRKKNCSVNPMQAVEIEFSYNEKNNLHKLHTVTPLTHLSNIYFDIYKMNIVMLWSEILNLVLKHDEKNEQLFDFIVQSVEYLNATQHDIANFNLFFLYRLPAMIGFGIDTAHYSTGDIFNIKDGIFCLPDAKILHASGPNTAKIIHQLTNCRLEEIKDIPLDRQSRNILLDIILLFFGIHLNIDFNIKSIEVIREVFS